MPKQIIVTGAGRGIGLSISERLALDGYNLVLITKTNESAEKIRNKVSVWPGNHSIISIDLSEAKEINNLIAQWKDSIWGLINNAGICSTYNMQGDTGLDPWNSVIGTNLQAPYLLTRGLLPFITRPGRIVNISSQLGLEGRSGYSAYCASKFGLIGLTKVWAKEFGASGLTVNAVCPGWVDTEMSRLDLARLAKSKSIPTDDYYNNICEPLELKRFNTPEEVADLVAYIVSERAQGISGRSWLMQTIWNQE
jgi:NAD(P)-dependent dehydrogenase (short-subunit alcohol dehydrogenase family)